MSELAVAEIVAETTLSFIDAEEYTQALGQVVAGGYRQIVLGKRLGVPQALGLTLEAWVQTRLGGYVRLSIPERREVVAELSAEGMSTREIGEVLGVSKDTARRDLDGANAPVADGDRPALALIIEDSGANDPEQIESERQEAAEKQRRWAATLNVLDGLQHFDRPAVREQAQREAALLDPLVAASRGEVITAERLRNAAAWSALLAEELERTTHA